MPIDREAALKKAEKLLRQGRLDGAIEEYARLVADQPQDWNAINALGDLYVRAGDSDRAVAQFTRVADYLFAEGFLPKAAALYKKALKVQGHHEHTLLRLGEIAARQGLLADARTYWGQLAERRRQRGDEAGAAECLGRIRALEEEQDEAGPVPESASTDEPEEGPERLLAEARQELAPSSPACSCSTRRFTAPFLASHSRRPGKDASTAHSGVSRSPPTRRCSTATGRGRSARSRRLSLPPHISRRS